MTHKEFTHNTIVDRVKTNLLGRGYISIETFVEYKACGTCGEIDLYVKQDKYVLLFEIKCNYSHKQFKKATSQLLRAERTYFKEEDRVFKFMVYKKGSIDDLVYQWIRA